ncbi:MAG TPA: hypothetical protein VFJ58_20265 [Armatimonadota bacterium]|nr:hypothetical protein [Armatimonadota bacterium]
MLVTLLMLMAGARAAGVTHSAGAAQLLIKPEKSVVGAAEPVVIDVSLRNTGKDDLAYFESNPEWDFKLSVTRHGKAVPLTAYGKASAAAHNRRPLSVFMFFQVLLKPGESSEYRFLVNQMYDFSIPDSYQIRVSRHVGIWQRHLGMVLQSNAVTVKVDGFDSSLHPPVRVQGAH